MGSDGKRTVDLHRAGAAVRRAREEARQVRSRLEHLIAASPAVIYTIPAGRAFGATFISSNVTAVLGYEPGEFTRDPAFWSDRIHPEDLERILPGVRERITRGTSYSWDYRFQAKDGTYRWMHDEGRLTTDDQGAPEFAGYWVDVTERKEAQETLRESRDRLEAILDAALPDLFFEIDGNGRILDYRAASEDLLYVPPAAFLGKTFADVLPRDAAEIISEGLTRARSLRQASSASYALDLPGGRRWFDLSIKPIGGPDPRGHLVCLVRDITERRRAEDALREASALNQQIIESAQEGIVVYDRELRYVTWNPFMERLSGIPARDVLGKRAPDLFPTLREQGVIERVERALTGETPPPVDVIHKRADGRWGWATDCASPLRDSEGRVVGAISIVQDISERKRSEQEILQLNGTLEGRVAERTARLAESEAWLRAILTSFPDAVVTIEDDGTVATFNPAAERAFGYTAAEVVGRNVAMLMPTPRHDEHDGQLDRYRRAGEAQLVGGAGEVEGRRKDGEAFPIEIWVAEVTLESRRAFVAAVRDITERKRDQEALRAAANEWQRSFDSIDVALVIIDVDGRVLRLNRRTQALSGRPYSELLGTDIRDLEPTGLWREATELALGPAGDGALRPIRIIDGGTGRTWEVRVSEVPHPDPQRTRRLIVAATDVTDAARMEEALRRSETMAALGSLASGVAHEVRGPLFALSANLDALEASVDAALATRLEPLRRSAARLNVLMEDLLDFTRPNTIRLAKGSFAGPIQEAREDCLSMADREGVLIVSDPDPADKAVLMDRDRLRQVFTNLLHNAIHHSGRDDTVRIEFDTVVDAGRRWVRCLVSDQGPGFREEDLQRAFEPFFTRRKGGTGLGLAIAKRIVLDHHGSIEARNLPAGGACVIVTLPLADA
jgi:PAS domain S-box-containing protein